MIHRYFLAGNPLIPADHPHSWCALSSSSSRIGTCWTAHQQILRFHSPFINFCHLHQIPSQTFMMMKSPSITNDSSAALCTSQSALGLILLMQRWHLDNSMPTLHGLICWLRKVFCSQLQYLTGTINYVLEYTAPISSIPLTVAPHVQGCALTDADWASDELD